MAKQNTLPSVENARPPMNATKNVEPKQTEVEGYQMRLASFRRVDVKLPHKHRVILRDKLRALQDGGARLADGTAVTDKTKAVLWILENFGS